MTLFRLVIFRPKKGKKFRIQKFDHRPSHSFCARGLKAFLIMNIGVISIVGTQNISVFCSFTWQAFLREEFELR